jgi:hypothetical protein
MRPPPPSSALQLLVLNSPSLGQLDNVATFAWKNSAHQVLLHCRSPHLRQVDQATTTVSTFRDELHPLENFNTKLPAAPRNCFSALSSYPKKFRKREKKQFALLPSQHTPTSHTYTILLYFLRQLDRFAQTLVLRSLSTWQVVVQKRKERDEDKA